MAKLNARDVISVPEILLPENADMSAWAVIACDQYTSDEGYWSKLRSYIGGKPSAYNVIFPEIYLKDNPDKRIADINAAMYGYLDSGFFKTVSGGFILVERTTKESGTRTGLMLAVDLEKYSFKAGAKTLIRSTEATILDRLPPRIKIRRNAPIELPHIMLLYDDPDFTVLNAARRGEVLYDFDLNMGGGKVKGTFIGNTGDVLDAYSALLDRQGEDKMLFAAGDGNHSLATAKQCWEELKPTLSEEERLTHPARFALCEVVNIYDKALQFHPIYRFVKTDEPYVFLNEYNLSGKGSATVVVNGISRKVPFPENVPEGIRRLDEYISAFISAHGGEVDYIHGEDELKALTLNGAGVIVPAINKGDFFCLIIEGGNLPRKTFSMGEGNEKRYYIEAKRIK
ncbi:MAG: DUF1015 domain-containing protein [Clostridia bacterium]|nr:DUF1015 domain-containing protein [Clostridia bacterium]